MYRSIRSSLWSLSRCCRLYNVVHAQGKPSPFFPKLCAPARRPRDPLVIARVDRKDTRQQALRDHHTGAMQQLQAKDRHMIRLYVAGCFHRWELLPDIAREFVAAGCSAEELRGCVRHLIVFAGYGPCLAATLALHKAKLLPADTPAKFGGPPGNAFELVYDNVTDVVRKRMHAADPAVGEWIRLHLYGDLYSSPGLDLRQKQLLACSFLGVAHMPDQLFGHAIAALRFGNSKAEVQEAVHLGFQMEPNCSDSYKDEAYNMLDMAYAKYTKDFSDQHSAPEVVIPDTSYVRVPALPPLYNAPPTHPTGGPGKPQKQAGGSNGGVTVAASGGGSMEGQQDSLGSLGRVGESMEEEGGCDGDDDVLFAWEEIDPRFDKSSRIWKKPVQPQTKAM